MPSLIIRLSDTEDKDTISKSSYLRISAYIGGFDFFILLTANLSFGARSEISKSSDRRTSVHA